MSAENEILAPPAVDEPILHAIAEAQARLHLLPPADVGELSVVIVGVSGGADSVCLLHALARLAPVWRLHLLVAHLDHALRADSAYDAAQVQGLAHRLGLACHVDQLAPDALRNSPDGLEAAARQARYAFLCRLADSATPSTQVPVVAVAHHADDQAETMVMHLVRGSGLRGIAGMRWSTERHTAGVPRPVRIVRPLLAVSRAAIRRYLAAHNLSWREDPSNADTTLLRNRIRHEVMPTLAALNPNLAHTLARTAQLLADEAVRAEAMDRRAFDALTAPPAADAPTPVRVVLPVERLRSYDIATQRGVLRLALDRLCVDLRDAGAGRIEVLLQALRQSKASGPHPLIHGIAWTLAPAGDEGGLQLSLHRASVLPLAADHPLLPPGWSADVPLDGSLAAPDGWRLVSRELAVDQLPAGWQGRPWSAFLDAERVAAPVLTTHRPGLRFAPLGMQGHHKLLGDCFTDRKVPAVERAGWPVVVDRATEEVIWICGHAIAHGPRITPDTRRVLSLVWIRVADAAGVAAQTSPETARDSTPVHAPCGPTSNH